MPDGVDDPGWSKDDATVLIGDGDVTLTVHEDGEVSGKSSGALGSLDIRGRVEDGVLSAGIVSSDAHADHAVAGLLTGQRRGPAIEAELRVANHDASLVRRASLRLARD